MATKLEAARELLEATRAEYAGLDPDSKPDGWAKTRGQYLAELQKRVDEAERHEQASDEPEPA